MTEKTPTRRPEWARNKNRLSEADLIRIEAQATEMEGYARIYTSLGLHTIANDYRACGTLVLAGGRSYVLRCGGEFCSFCMGKTDKGDDKWRERSSLSRALEGAAEAGGAAMALLLTTPRGNGPSDVIDRRRWVKAALSSLMESVWWKRLVGFEAGVRAGSWAYKIEVDFAREWAHWHVHVPVVVVDGEALPHLRALWLRLTGGSISGEPIRDARAFSMYLLKATGAVSREHPEGRLEGATPEEKEQLVRLHAYGSAMAPRHGGETRLVGFRDFRLCGDLAPRLGAKPSKGLAMAPRRRRGSVAESVSHLALRQVDAPADVERVIEVMGDDGAVVGVGLAEFLAGSRDPGEQQGAAPHSFPVFEEDGGEDPVIEARRLAFERAEHEAWLECWGEVMERPKLDAFSALDSIAAKLLGTKKTREDGGADAT